MNNYYLVGIAALIVIAVGLLLRWYHKRSAAARDERHLRSLQHTLGIQPGVRAKGDGDKGKVGSDVKKPNTALVVYSDGLRVNGAWLNEVKYFTGDPNPLYGTKQSVRDAQSRARGHYEKCRAARKEQNWELAEQHLEAAFQELDKGMRRDHWFAAELFHQQGRIRYEQGQYGEARDLWEKAEMVWHEWPTMCHNLLPTIEANLKLVRGYLGF